MTRDRFVARFGEEQAQAVERLGLTHIADWARYGNRGLDEFRALIVLGVGYECFTRFATAHGITVPWDELRGWIKAQAEVGRYDGQIDQLALAAGLYDEFLTEYQPVLFVLA